MGERRVDLRSMDLVDCSGIGRDGSCGDVMRFFLSSCGFRDVCGGPRGGVRTLERFGTILAPSFDVFIRVPITLRLFTAFGGE